MGKNLPFRINIGCFLVTYALLFRKRSQGGFGRNKILHFLQHSPNTCIFAVYKAALKCAQKLLQYYLNMMKKDFVKFVNLTGKYLLFENTYFACFQKILVVIKLVSKVKMTILNRILFVMITVNGQYKLTLYNMILQNGGKHSKISLVTADELFSVFQYCGIIS